MPGMQADNSKIIRLHDDARRHRRRRRRLSIACSRAGGMRPCRAVRAVLGTPQCDLTEQPAPCFLPPTQRPQTAAHDTSPLSPFIHFHT